MPNPVRPTANLDWTVGNPNFGTVTVEPTGGKKLTGWTPSEKPPRETMNWLFYIVDQWLKWIAFSIDELTQQLATLSASLTAQVAVHEIPAGVVNGVNAVFTLSDSPVNVDSCWPTIDGIQVQKAEFALAGTQLTLLTPPAPGQTVDVVFIKEVGVSLPVGGGGSPIGYTPYGSAGAPLTVSPLIGVPILTSQRQMIFCKSNGGAAPVTANPQVQPHSVVGAEAILVGTDDVDYLSLADGNGLALNGPIDLKSNKTITLVWTGAVWLENGRR